MFVIQKQSGTNIVYIYISKIASRKPREEVESRTRAAVQNVLPCDVLAKDPFFEVSGKVDAILSSLTLGAAVNDIQGFKHALTKMCEALNPHWYLYVVECLNDRWYSVGGLVFSYFNIPQGLIQQILHDNGLLIVEEFFKIFPEDEKREVCPHQMQVCLIVGMKI